MGCPYFEHFFSSSDKVMGHDQKSPGLLVLWLCFLAIVEIMLHVNMNCNFFFSNQVPIVDSSPISAGFSSTFLPRSKNTDARLTGDFEIVTVGSLRPRLREHLWMCFELNFHLSAEFDIKHTFICHHAHNYWLHLPCLVHFCTNRRLNLHRGLQEEAMSKPMMSKFTVNKLESNRVKIWRTFWKVFILPPPQPP